MDRWEEFVGGTRRAPRFSLEFPLSYRPSEDSVWRQGRGTNISRSGVLFRADAPLQLQQRVEVSFPIPVEIPGRPAATVVCRGQVVRLVEQPEQGVLIAATIESYRFRRPSESS